MSRRPFILGAAAVIAAGTIASTAVGGYAVGGDPSTYGTIGIAVEGPLTGSQASNGQDMLRGVQLAVKQYNAKGGFDGRCVQIVKVDDQGSASMAKPAAAEAIKAKVVALIGPYNSSVGLVNLPIYTRAKLVPVQMTSTDDTTGYGVTVQPKNSQISPVEPSLHARRHQAREGVDDRHRQRLHLWDPRPTGGGAGAQGRAGERGDG